MERWTVLRVLEWTRGYLQRKGISSPRLESELLLSHILGFNRVALYLNYDMALSSEELKRFREVVERRVTGEPIQYIRGYQEFWSIPFKVSPDVLIPRPETEILVEEALRLIELEGWDRPMIVDVGTGCGAIAISIAKSVRSSNVIATEISWEAIALARENAKIQDVASKIAFVQGDLLSCVKSGRAGGCHLIVSNPPYIEREDVPHLPREIKDFEPQRAIDGGTDGLGFYRRFFVEAPTCLRTGGWLILEIGAYQGERILRILEQIGGLSEGRIIPDYAGKSRAIITQKTGQ